MKDKVKLLVKKVLENARGASLDPHDFVVWSSDGDTRLSMSVFPNDEPGSVLDALKGKLDVMPNESGGYDIIDLSKYPGVPGSDEQLDSLYDAMQAQTTEYKKAVIGREKAGSFNPWSFVEYAAKVGVKIYADSGDRGYYVLASSEGALKAGLEELELAIESDFPEDYEDSEEEEN